MECWNWRKAPPSEASAKKERLRAHRIICKQSICFTCACICEIPPPSNGIGEHSLSHPCNITRVWFRCIHELVWFFEKHQIMLPMTYNFFLWRGYRDWTSQRPPLQVKWKLSHCKLYCTSTFFPGPSPTRSIYECSNLLCTQSRTLSACAHILSRPQANLWRA